MISYILLRNIFVSKSKKFTRLIRSREFLKLQLQSHQESHFLNETKFVIHSVWMKNLNLHKNFIHSQKIFYKMVVLSSFHRNLVPATLFVLTSAKPMMTICQYFMTHFNNGSVKSKIDSKWICYWDSRRVLHNLWIFRFITLINF